MWAYICRFRLLLASLSLSSQVCANFCRSGLISPGHLVLYPHVQAYICRLRLIFLFAFAHLACQSRPLPRINWSSVRISILPLVRITFIRTKGLPSGGNQPDVYQMSTRCLPDVYQMSYQIFPYISFGSSQMSTRCLPDVYQIFPCLPDSTRCLPDLI